jgi:hypothetical protein
MLKGKKRSASASVFSGVDPQRRYLILSTRCLPWWPFGHRESWELTPLSLD